MANDKTPIKNTQTAFKVVVYWIYKKEGLKYTQIEINAKMNRRFLSSHDYTIFKGEALTNHELALKKLDKMLGVSYTGKFYTAIVIYNTQLGEIAVRKYTQFGLQELRPIEFYITGKNLNEVRVKEITGNPILINGYDPNNINCYDIINREVFNEFNKKSLYEYGKGLKTLSYIDRIKSLPKHPV